MIPKAREVRLKPKVRKVLEARSRAPTTPQCDVRRAGIVLLAAAEYAIDFSRFLRDPFFFRKIWGQHRHVFWQRYAVARAELVALQNRRATNVADVSISTV